MICKNPRITVLMSVYNGDEYLRESIESILNQTFYDFEFLIISEYDTSDESLAIIQSYSDERIRHIHNTTHLGLVKSLNRGLKEAKGKYVARMDADDISFRDRLKLQFDFIETNPRLAVVGGAVVQIDEIGRKHNTIKYPQKDKQVKEKLFNGWCCFAHSTVLIRKEFVCLVGGYRNCFNLAEDYDLWLRLADSYELVNISRPVLYLRAHRKQVSLQNLRKQTILSIGARTAAKIRRETGNDPFTNSKNITFEDLHQYGIDYRIIEIEIIKSSLWWIKNMFRNGYSREGFQLSSQIQKSVSSCNNEYSLHFYIGYYYLASVFIVFSQKKISYGTKLLIDLVRLNLGLVRNEQK